VVPAERSLVDLGKSESAALVRVLDMGEIVVEVVVLLLGTAIAVVRYCLGQMEAMNVGEREVREI
jgi:hypothetical protein